MSKEHSVAIASQGQDIKAPDHAVGNAKIQGGNTVENVPPEEFDALGFYSRAYIIWAKFIQQQEDVLHSLRHSNIKKSTEVKPRALSVYHGVDVPKSMDTASPEHALVNSFALLLSTSRNSTEPYLTGTPSASEVTATALRIFGPTTGEGGFKYTLYIAKNGDISNEDDKLIKSMKDWMNWEGGNECTDPRNQDWSLVTTHISDRIQSYLGFSDNDKFSKCNRLFQRARFDIPTGDTNTLSFLSALRDLLVKIKPIKNEVSSNSSSQDTILILCYEFTRDYADDISRLMAYLKRSRGRGDHILFVISGIEKLAKIPRAFGDLFKFRKSCITKDKDYFDIAPVPKCDSAPECHPGMSNVKSYIKELERNPTYDHIKQELGKVIRDIKPQWTTVHCEIKVLNYILEQATKKEFELREMYGFIGCSKRPCYLCAGTINLGTSFEVAASHWKLYSAWGLPKALLQNEKIVNALSSLWYRMDETLKDEILRPREENSIIENEWIDWDWNPALVPESPVFTYSQANHREAPSAEDLERVERELEHLELLD